MAGVGRASVQRTWSGRVELGHENEHRDFVDWLISAEGQGLLARSLLTDYRLVQDGERLTATLAADDPPALIRFLRNRRFWPEYWLFESADSSEALGPEADELVHWRRDRAADEGGPTG